MIIQVCVGSACHLKGSYDVINNMKSYIASEGIEEKVVLKSSFCLGQCSDDVSVKVDDGKVQSVCPESAVDFIKSCMEAV